MRYVNVDACVCLPHGKWRTGVKGSQTWHFGSLATHLGFLLDIWALSLSSKVYCTGMIVDVTLSLLLETRSRTAIAVMGV